MGRQSWVFDLVAADEAVRRRALARHQASIAAAAAALHWSNAVWAQAGTPAPTEPRLAAEMDQARAAQRWHTDQTIFGLLRGFHSEDPLVREIHAPFVVLYLLWERRYPDEWRPDASNMWSPWGAKEGLLDTMARRGVPDDVRPHLTDLFIEVLQGPYRCKDWMYAGLVRHLHTAPFAARIEALADAEDPLIRLRAQFILWVAARPELRIKRVTWRRWLATDPGG